MHEVVYRLMSRLCALVEPLPVGTNLGLVKVFWMLVTGQLLATRGAVVPALSASGLAPPAVRLSCARLGHGARGHGGLVLAPHPQGQPESDFRPRPHAAPHAPARAH